MRWSLALVVVLTSCGRIGFDELGDGGFVGPDVVLPRAQVGIAAGGTFSCALRSDGLVWCWGDGRDGQLGDAMRNIVATPQLVPGVSDVVAIDAGDQHACALTSTGAVWCWGDNQYRRVGVEIDGLLPATRVPLPGAATAISTGSLHSCALLSDHTAWCWGKNLDGRLGVSGSQEGRAPVQSFDNVLVTPGGEVWCWGNNDSGQLGDGTTQSRATPVPIPAFDASSLSLGANFSCGLNATNTAAVCWGGNRTGELADGGGTGSPTPIAVTASSNLTRVTAGDYHACEVSATTEVPRCWGENFDGQVGNGRRQAIELPQSVITATSGPFATIVAGSSHMCGRSTAGLAYCWGGNNYGQLGDGTTTGQPTPTLLQVPGSGHDFGLGTNHSCVSTTAGNYCWGANFYGELGDGSAFERLSPTPVQGLPTSSTIAAGEDFTCARTPAAEVFCWGDNSRGQLGQGFASRSIVPTAVNFP